MLFDDLPHHIDYVMHYGALLSPWGKYEAFYAANILGTRYVVAGCLKHVVTRLILKTDLIFQRAILFPR